MAGGFRAINRLDNDCPVNYTKADKGLLLNKCDIITGPQVRGQIYEWRRPDIY